MTRAFKIPQGWHLGEAWGAEPDPQEALGERELFWRKDYDSC